MTREARKYLYLLIGFYLKQEESARRIMHDIELEVFLMLQEENFFDAVMHCILSSAKSYKDNREKLVDLIEEINSRITWKGKKAKKKRYKLLFTTFAESKQELSMRLGQFIEENLCTPELLNSVWKKYRNCQHYLVHIFSSTKYVEISNKELSKNLDEIILSI